jgi:hypothetical protein
VQRQQPISVVLAWQQLVLCKRKLLQSLGFGDLRGPLREVAGAATAQAIHEDGGAGGLFAAEDAVFAAPLEKFAEGALASGGGGRFEVFVFCYGAVFVEVVVGPGAGLLVEDFAGQGEVEEVAGEGCRGGVCLVGFVWDVSGVEVGGDFLNELRWEGCEVVSHFLFPLGSEAVQMNRVDGGVPVDGLR